MRIYFLILLISFIFCGCNKKNETSDNKKLETSYKCTTKVVLFWKDSNLLKRNKILNEAFNVRVRKEEFPLVEQMGSLKDNEWLYFMFSSGKCKQKYKNTVLILNRYFNNIKDAPKYKIIKNISKKEFEVLTNQIYNNPEIEIKKWLNKETIKQLNTN